MRSRLLIARVPLLNYLNFSILAAERRSRSSDKSRRAHSLRVSRRRQWNRLSDSDVPLSSFGELVDPVVANPVAQDNNKRNNLQIYAQKLPIEVRRVRGRNFPILMSCGSCLYLVELAGSTGCRCLFPALFGRPFTRFSARFAFCHL